MTTIVDRTRELCDEMVVLNIKEELCYDDIERMDEILMEMQSLQSALLTMLDLDYLEKEFPV